MKSAVSLNDQNEVELSPSKAIEARDLEKAIKRSQHCQRNWDLSKEIPEQDISLFTFAISQCPSKQNIAYYKAHLITNREIIEAIHAKTNGFVTNFENGESTTNSQTLANLLVVFEAQDLELVSDEDALRNTSTYDISHNNGEASVETKYNIERDQNMAVGIAAGYLNLTASLIGYATGCCACFDQDGVQKILKLDKPAVLLMGIGFKDESLGRRIHHMDKSFVFPTKHKQRIKINRLS